MKKEEDDLVFEIEPTGTVDLGAPHTGLEFVPSELPEKERGARAELRSLKKFTAEASDGWDALHDKSLELALEGAKAGMPSMQCVYSKSVHYTGDDEEQAAGERYLREAVDAEYPPAQYMMANRSLYEGRSIVPEDSESELSAEDQERKTKAFTRAIRLWRKAAQQGYSRALMELADFFKVESESEDETAKKVALFCLEAAVEADHPDALVWMGWWHARGMVVVEDIAQAKSCWRESEEKGHLERKNASRIAGFFSAPGVEHYDRQEALYWSRFSSERQGPFATSPTFDTVALLLAGRPSSKEVNEAEQLLRRLAEWDNAGKMDRIKAFSLLHHIASCPLYGEHDYQECKAIEERMSSDLDIDVSSDDALPF